MKELFDKIYKHISLIMLLIFSVLLYIIFLLQSQDNDMFFEIMSGRDILNGNFYTASHLNNFPIVVQQWLYAVCLAITDKFGNIGNFLFVFVQDVILCVLCYIFIIIKTNNKKFAIFGAIFSILYCHEYIINIRPQIITAICLIAQLILMELYKKKKQIRYLFAIFPILILSANMHQGVFLYHGFIMLPYYYKKENHCMDLTLVFFTPFFMLCSLLTPYGLDGSLYIFKTFMTNSFEIVGISELSPISIVGYSGIKLLIVCGLTIFLIYKQKSNIFLNFFAFAITILSLSSVRHISILIIAVLFLLCALSEFNIQNNNFIRNSLCLVCALLCFVFLQNINDFRQNYGKVADIISDKNAPIYNAAIDLGGWLEYSGCINVKLDSRCEAFSEEISGISNIIEDYFTISQGFIINEDLSYTLAEDEQLLEILQNYKYVIAKKNQYVNRTLKRNNTEWTQIFDDGVYTVYLHND